MKNSHHYYRVQHQDTSVIELSIHNFTRAPNKTYRTIWVNNHPVKVYFSLAHQPYRLDPIIAEYHDYVDKTLAMEKAKEGALQYMNMLIKQGWLIVSTLKQYRMDHYGDLNEHLLDRNIRELERAMKNN